MNRSTILMGIVAGVFGSAAVGQVTPTGPFSGVYSEDFDSTAGGSYLSLPVFSGQGVANRMYSTNALVVWDQAPPANSPPNYMFGRGTDVDWDFTGASIPVTKFGGYFRDVPVISQPPTQATFNFYDVNNVLFDTTNAPIINVWTWIGWESNIPIRRVEVIGNGNLFGYIGHDDMEIIPEPAGIGLLLLGIPPVLCAPVGLRPPTRPDTWGHLSHRAVRSGLQRGACLPR